jgi:hypothetical protein
MRLTPSAAPAAAMIKPNLELNCPLELAMNCHPSYYFYEFSIDSFSVLVTFWLE